MTARLNARQLHQAWDARARGELPPLPVDNLDEWELLELLANTRRPAPNPAFVRALERELTAASDRESITVPPLVTRASRPRLAEPAPGRWRRPPSRWMAAGYALAAIALVVFLSIFAIARQGDGDDEGPAIPAVSEWIDAGPPTSPGVETTPLFSHTFSADELADYAFDQWGWLQFMRGTVEPGERSNSGQHSLTAEGDAGADTTRHPGIGFIEVERGQLAAHLTKPALVGDRSSSEQLARVAAGADVTLEAGETLVFGAGALSEFWNPADVEAGYVAGDLSSLPGFPIDFPESKPNDLPTPISFDASLFAGTGLLNISIDQVSIGPGETYAYAVTPQTLLVADVIEGGLTKQAWSNGAPVGGGQSLLASSYSLHEDGPGYYTLTNTSEESIAIYYLTAAPPGGVQLSPDSALASADTIFEQVFSQSQLMPYRPDEWGWIELLHETELDPGQQWPVIDGSNGTPVPGWPGLSVVGIDSGELTVRLNKPVLVRRAGTGTMEAAPAAPGLVLQAGDALIFETGAVASVWNLGATRAEFVAGGLYDRPHYPTQHAGTGILDTPGGSSFDSAVVTGPPSLELSIRKISIAPGENYRYTIGPRTLLLAAVRGEGIQKTAWIDGTPSHNSPLLLVSMYTLHNDSPGDYSLTNTGSEPVEVFFFQAEGQRASGAPASPAPVDAALF